MSPRTARAVLIAGVAASSCWSSCTPGTPKQPVAPVGKEAPAEVVPATVDGSDGARRALDRGALGDVAFTCTGAPLYPQLPAPAPSVELEVVHPGALGESSTVMTLLGGEPRVFRSSFELSWEALRLGYRLRLEAELVDAAGVNHGSVWLSPTVEGADGPSGRSDSGGPLPPEATIDPSGGVLFLDTHDQLSRADRVAYSLTCKNAR